jgi:hypothetical protein
VELNESLASEETHRTILMPANGFPIRRFLKMKRGVNGKLGITPIPLSDTRHTARIMETTKLALRCKRLLRAIRYRESPTGHHHFHLCTHPKQVTLFPLDLLIRLHVHETHGCRRHCLLIVQAKLLIQVYLTAQEGGMAQPIPTGLLRKF